MKINKTLSLLSSRSQPEERKSRFNNPYPGSCQLLRILWQQSEGVSNPAKGDQKQQPEGEILELSLKEHFHHRYSQFIRESPSVCKGTGIVCLPMHVVHMCLWSECYREMVLQT